MMFQLRYSVYQVLRVLEVNIGSLKCKRDGVIILLGFEQIFLELHLNVLSIELRGLLLVCHYRAVLLFCWLVSRPII